MSYGIGNPLNPAQPFHGENYDALEVWAMSFRSLPVRVPAGATLQKGLLLEVDATNSFYQGVANPTGTNVSAVLMEELTNTGSSAVDLSATVAVGHFNFSKVLVLNASNQCVPVTETLLTNAEIAALATRNIVVHRSYR